MNRGLFLPGGTGIDAMLMYLLDLAGTLDMLWPPLLVYLSCTRDL